MGTCSLFLRRCMGQWLILVIAGTGLCLGASDPAAEARQRRVSGKIVEPRPDSTQSSTEALDQFSRIYDHMLGFWQSAAQPPS